MTHLWANLFVRPEARAWARFLATAADPRWLACELRAARGRDPTFERVPLGLKPAVEPTVRAIVAAPDEAVLRAFLVDRSLPGAVRDAVAFTLARILSTPPPPRLDELLAELRLVRGASPYEMLAALLPRFDGIAAIARHARARLGIGDPSLEMFTLRRMLFERNVVLRAERAVRCQAEDATP